MAITTVVNPFGEWEGRMVSKYTIAEQDGLQVSVINYGATVTAIQVPDRNGIPADVVLGFNTMEEYVRAGNYYIGGICGRFANRIAGASFPVNGRTFKLSVNDGTHCLHGGKTGFDKVFWEAALLPDGNGVCFSYLSKDGEEGFPGNLNASVVYRLTDHALQITYSAETDKATPVNLTSHCYFNLSGHEQKNILDHALQINAGRYLEVDEELIPTGKYRDVDDTWMDFREIRMTGTALKQLNGFDHCWVLDRQNGELAKAAQLFHEGSGRILTVYTTQPGIHFYSGHMLNEGREHTADDQVYGRYAGLCLETQHFPDSPNHPGFPDTILQPGEKYREQTVYSFTTDAHKFVKTKSTV